MRGVDTNIDSKATFFYHKEHKGRMLTGLYAQSKLSKLRYIMLSKSRLCVPLCSL